MNTKCGFGDAARNSRFAIVDCKRWLFIAGLRGTIFAAVPGLGCDDEKDCCSNADTLTDRSRSC